MTVMVILLTMPLTGGPGGWKMGLSLSGWIPYTKCALKVLIQVREKLGFDGIPNNCLGFPKGECQEKGSLTVFYFKEFYSITFCFYRSKNCVDMKECNFITTYSSSSFSNLS